MQWSQLKSRIEDGFAASVKGRVEVWSTRYRRAHDKQGESWITIDGQKVVTMGTLRFQIDFYGTNHQLLQDRDCADYHDPDKLPDYRKAHDDATRIVHDRGVFASHELRRSLCVYLNLSIEEAWNSENNIIRAFAVLDRRFGKRRLAGLEMEGEHPLVELLALFRCRVEDVTTTS